MADERRGPAPRRDFRGGRRDFKRGERKEKEEKAVTDLRNWVPKTALGKEVMAGKYATLYDVLASGKRIMEPEIVDFLEPNMTIEFINVGQAKGKFGGGKRKISKPTQKKTQEGSKMHFLMISVIGNRNGIVGLGFGKSRETVPSREKAIRNVKLNIIQIRRGNGSWGSFGAGSTSIPFSVEGKCGSSRVKLIPAPIGTGIVAEGELKKMLELAGIKDVWSRTFGQTRNKINLMKAGFDALSQLQKVRLTAHSAQGRALKDGDKDE